MDDRGASKKRSRREATTEAILDAAEELFALGGPESVSVRDIAARAGVSHALVHRYLGKKNEIYDAVLKRDQDRFVQSSVGAQGLSEGVRSMLAELLDRPEYAKLIAHSVLHGLDWETRSQGSRGVRRLLELAAADIGSEHESPATRELDHRFVVAAIVAMSLGWLALEPWLRRAARLEDLDDAQFRQSVTRMAMRMLGDEQTGGG